MPDSTGARGLSAFVKRVSRINPLALALLYMLAYALLELLVQNPIRLYIYNVFLALSGVYFAWFMGGRLAMFYVAFFNLFIVFVFSKMMWTHNVVVTPQVFLSRSFLAMYLLAGLVVTLMLRRQSPADKRAAEQQLAIEEEKRQRENLEYMVASRKLKQDLLAQANLVKDELQLMESAWRSNIHDIINDLSPSRERALYQQIILPFQSNIITHLRDLEMRLTFDVQPVRLGDLSEFLRKRLAGFKKGEVIELSFDDAAWAGAPERVLIDKNKVWDMLQNVLRNSQTALDLQRVERLRRRAPSSSNPFIRISLTREEGAAILRVRDNGGGAPPEIARLLYVEPAPSRKRGGVSQGQGTLFVKFFADRMGVDLSARNVGGVEGDKEIGLEVCLRFPYESSHVG
jgi:signal transduction histidine kinase